jgi:3-oxoadipate enol-lactonase
MPYASAPSGPRIHYELWDGGASSQTVVFSHGYLMNRHMFDGQIERLRGHYRVVAFDHRGHGASDPWQRPFDVYDLVDDAVRVIEATSGGEPVHFVGMSTGGYVALRLMKRRPDLLRSAVLIDTSAGAEPARKRLKYGAMLLAVRWLGLRSVMGSALAILMGEPFRSSPARRDELEQWRRHILQLDRRSVVAFGRAIFGRDDFSRALAECATPALVVVGALDIATPPDQARAMAAALGAELVTIAGAGHTSPIEEPDAVSDAIEAFLARLSSTTTGADA